MAEYILLYVYIPHLFCPLSVNGHLVYFHVLAIVSSAAMNIGVRVSSQLEFLSFPDTCPGVGLMDHMVVLLLVF